MIKLTCPSCNGTLELPDKLGVYHCMYCGTKILMDHPDTVNETKATEKYKELCTTAMESKNYIEAIKYCNSILEISPKDVESWINKGIATYWLTTGKDDRYEEAMEYLKKGKTIDPDNSRIYEIRSELTKQYAHFVNLLGVNSFTAGDKIRNIYLSGLNFIAADNNSKKHFIDAMNYYISASNNDPENMIILANIELCAKKGSFIEWSKLVYEKLQIFEKLNHKKEAADKLLEHREEADKIKKEIELLKNKTGFFDKNKRKNLDGKLEELIAQITDEEKDSSFKPLPVQFDW